MDEGARLSSVRYQVVLPDGVERSSLTSVVTRWSVRLSTSSFALDEALRGETDLTRSTSLADDCVVLVLALCELELQAPGAIAVLSDERGLFGPRQRPHEVELAALRRRAEQLELEATQLALARALRRLT